MTPQPSEQPRTAAGRALVDMPLHTAGIGSDRDDARLLAAVLAIEAQAAAPDPDHEHDWQTFTGPHINGSATVCSICGLLAAAPDPVASPADDWVICQTCEGDGGWPTSAAPVPLDHGYSPRPDWAGTCPRCGAKAGDNCAVLTDPVASPALDGLRPFLLHRVTAAIVDGLAEYARLEGQPVAEEPT